MHHKEYQIEFTKRAGHSSDKKVEVTREKVYYSILKFTIVNGTVKCDRHFSVYYSKLY